MNLYEKSTILPLSFVLFTHFSHKNHAQKKILLIKYVLIFFVKYSTKKKIKKKRVIFEQLATISPFKMNFDPEYLSNILLHPIN